jgi:NADH dehydrogenase FAD-containing subunit
VIGSAREVDFNGRTVEIARADGTVTVLPYDQLVIATGARSTSPDMPWKASGTYTEALASLRGTAARVADAQHIVVAGAGGTGIEVAGELGYEYGKTKEIVLLCSGDKLAGGHGVAGAAANELKKLNVTIKYNSRVTETRPGPQGTGGKTEVVLASGEIVATDLYLPTTGLVPNTEYIPARFLSADSAARTVLVDEYLRVLDTKNVWACGDVVSKPRAGFFITQKQAASVAKNVEAALAGLAPAVAKGPPVDIFACAVGRGRGVGRINNSIRMPSIMVWAAKGRTLAVPMVKGYIDGSVA